MSMLLGGGAPGSAATAFRPAPPGYGIVGRDDIAPGLTHVRLRRSSPSETVDVARVAAGSRLTLRTVVARRTTTGKGSRSEPTSAMCARVGCLVGINGDFFATSSGEPSGGLVERGQLVRSPPSKLAQLIMGPNGRLSTQQLGWRGTLMPTDLRPLAFHGVNVPRRPDRIILYTPSFRGTTGTNRHGTELIMRVVRPAGPLRLGQTALVRLAELRVGRGNAGIPRDGVVLSGHGRGARALAGLWARVRAGTASGEALLRVESTPGALESLGGRPVLIRDGRRAFVNYASSFVRSRAPRTIVGWNRAGDVFLVTVDGRQPGYSMGMSLAEAADLMLRLGATDALNLDGGGSTTFVKRRAVVNSPSDGVERPVATALVVVPRTPVGARPADPLGGRIALPRTAAPPAPLPAGDASAGALPALVAEPVRADRLPVAIAALLAVSSATVVTTVRRRIRRRVPRAGP